MSETVHLLIEKGVSKGMEIVVPPQGARLGRSDKNDIVVVDPELSRHHCRLFFKPGDGLWITDLGSSNKTMVNNLETSESALKTGDTVNIGDTEMIVLNDGRSGQPAPPALTHEPVVDLGLETSNSPNRKKTYTGSLITLMVVVIAIAAAVWLPKILNKLSESENNGMELLPADKTLSIEYEKVQGSTDNIFRYYLKITPDRHISIEIDDIINDFHIRDESKNPISQELIDGLIEYIEDSDFYTLKNEYVGLQEGIHDRWEMSATIGTTHHSVLVLNRIEPPAFKEFRDKIERFGRNELGHLAIQHSADELRQMANDAFLLGQKLYDEREIKFGNLSKAIKAFKQAQHDLNSIDPKPEYYSKVLSRKAECEKLLKEKYDDYNFISARAQNLSEWEKAAKYLRIILETIPDRADPRNEDARKSLLEVEARIDSLR